MSFEYICDLLDGAFVGDNIKEELLGSFKINSKEIEVGDAFIAINSGVNFVNDAINRGAKLIISEEKIDYQCPNIIVSDTKKALLSLAHQIRKEYLNIPLIAITGSVGKTTTKELISSILECKYNVLKSIGNKNNLIGVPETILSLNNTYDICVVELGMNHLNEISTLSKTVLPDRAIITNIGTSHIGYLKSKKNILKAKSEILDGMNDGVFYINGDDKYLRKIKYKKIVKVGIDRKNSLVASNIVITKEKLYFNITLDGRRYNIVFNIPNKALITNVLLAIKVGLDYDVPIEDIINKINEYKPLSHRNNVIKLKNNITVIDDCYNSCFESLNSGLEMVSKYDEEKIYIIGDILELGKCNKKIHKKIGRMLNKLDGTVILVGSEVKYAYNKKFILVQDVKEAIKALQDMELNNKVIYLKGSRKIGLEHISEYLKNVLI